MYMEAGGDGPPIWAYLTNTRHPGDSINDWESAALRIDCDPSHNRPSVGREPARKSKAAQVLDVLLGRVRGWLKYLQPVISFEVLAVANDFLIQCQKILDLPILCRLGRVSYLHEVTYLLKP